MPKDRKGIPTTESDYKVDIKDLRFMYYQDVGGSIVQISSSDFFF